MSLSASAGKRVSNSKKSSVKDLFFYLFNQVGSFEDFQILTYQSNPFKLLRRHGVVVINTARLHSAKPELKFCTGSNPVRYVLEIRNDEDH